MSMTKEQKQKKMEKLDELLLDKMIDIMESKDKDAIDELSTLSTPMNYLKNNQIVADKSKSTVEEETEKRLAEARKRRAKGESK